MLLPHVFSHQCASGTLHENHYFPDPLQGLGIILGLLQVMEKNMETTIICYNNMATCYSS